MPPIDFMTGNHHADGMATISLFLICPSSPGANLAQPVTTNLRVAARRVDAAGLSRNSGRPTHSPEMKLLMCCSHRHQKPNSSASAAWKATAGQLANALSDLPPDAP